jgi:hemolysin III
VSFINIPGLLLKFPSKLREPVNGLTHFIGVIFAIVSLLILVNREYPVVTGIHRISFSIFSASQFFLFLASTLYHWIPATDNKLVVLRKIDHIMIFVSIAGSYTPICLITLGGTLGYITLAVVWTIALAGFFIKVFWLDAPRKLYTAIYLAMGWLVILVIYPLYNAMPDGGMFWLILEAVFYTVGALIYAFKKPDPFPGIMGFHEIFHIFILLGAFSHFYLLLKFV